MHKFVLTAVFLALLLGLLFSPDKIPESDSPIQIIDNKPITAPAYIAVNKEYQ